VSRRLTISAGLRYEFPQRWHDRDTGLNRMGTLDVSAVSRAMGGRFLLGGSPDYYLPGQGVVQGMGRRRYEARWWSPRGGISSRASALPIAHLMTTRRRFAPVSERISRCRMRIPSRLRCFRRHSSFKIC